MSRVFVGNLNFKTTKEDLLNLFAEAGKVTNANIVSRGQPLGYGFVEYESIDDAKKAVEKFHHHSLGERQINVELAHPRDPNAPKQQGFRGRGRGLRRPPFNSQPGDALDSERGRGRGRGGRGGRGRGGRGGRGGMAPNAVPQEGAPDNRLPKFTPNTTNQPFSNYQSNFSGPRYNRPPRRDIQRDRPISKTVLFVGNLPFILTNDELKDAFKTYNPIKAYVIPRRYDTRNKGFGFVEFSSEEDRDKILNVTEDFLVKNRKVSVRKATEPPVRPKADETSTPSTSNTPVPAN